MTLYSFSLRPLPIFAWLSLAGALMAIILSWFYVPFLAKAALAANKKVPMYHQEKDYVFHEDYMTFSSKDVEPMNIPYDRFTTLCKTFFVERGVKTGRVSPCHVTMENRFWWFPAPRLKKRVISRDTGKAGIII